MVSEIGRHIVVYGPAGSGKTFVALKISRLIGVPHIELDSLFWLPEWQEKSLEDFRNDVSTIIDENPGGWVFDGNYGRVRDLILPLTDTVIWLRLPFRVVFWNLLKRSVTRMWKKDVLWGTNRESWRGMFFSRDSLLLYVIRNWKRYRQKISQDLNEMPHHATVIELHSLKEVESFLTNSVSNIDS